MALAAKPFGFRPHRGARAKTAIGTLNATHSVIGIGDVILEGSAGWIRATTEATTTLTAIAGIAAEPKAANTGGDLLVWTPDNIFEAQSDEASNYSGQTTNAAIQGQGIDVNCNVDRNSTTLRSTMVLDGSTVGTAGYACKLLRYAPYPGNDKNSATSYPIFLCTFSLADIATASI